MSDYLACLTVKQPWAAYIMEAGKDVENRTWRTGYRGPLVIHAGKQRAPLADYLQDTLSPWQILSAPLTPTGVIVGVVDLVDCVQDAESAWAEEGCWHWLLANPRPLPAWLPWTGMQGLWRLRREALLQRLQEQAEDVAEDVAEAAGRFAAVNMLLEVMGS